MSAKVLSIALVAAIVALPVPASQFLAGTFSSPTLKAVAAPGQETLGLLQQDPFLIDSLSFSRPKSFVDLDARV